MLKVMVGGLVVGLWAAAVGAPREVRVSDFGFDAADSTRFLQAAIRSGAERVIVDKRESAWITEPLFAVSNQEIFFEPGVELVAKKGSFLGRNDTLITLDRVQRVRLIGPSAVLRMHHDDYMNPPYKKAEWRNVINILSSESVTIEDLTLKDSGGDGIYVGCSGRSGPPCREIVVRRVISDGNARQGSSIITVDGLLYEDCVFRNTHGRPPEAGIDIEPNRRDEIVRNSVFRRCRFENNAGSGFNLTHPKGTDERAPCDVRLEDCVFVGNRVGFVYGQGGKKPYFVRGHFVVTNCVFERTRGSAVVIGRKIGDTMRAEVADCRIVDCCAQTPLMGDIRIDSIFGNIPPPSSITLRNIEIVQNTPHEEILFTDMPYGAFDSVNLKGCLSVKTPSGSRRIVLDDAFRRRELPGFWNAGEPKRRALSGNVDTIVDRKPGKSVRLPLLTFKGTARYAFVTRDAETVRFSANRSSKDAATDVTKVSVVSLAGNVNGEVGSWDAKGGFSVRVATGGVHVMRVESPRAAFGLTHSSVPVAFDLSEEPLNLRSRIGDLYLNVRGERAFNVMTCGASYGERIGASLFAPDGREIWSENRIASWRGVRVRERSRDGLWRLSFRKPEKCRLEDYSVDVTGLPPLLFLSPEKYWCMGAGGKLK